MPLKDKTSIERLLYNSRRLKGVSPAVVPDEDVSKVALEADVFLDVAKGRSRIYRSSGKSTQAGRAPPVLMGKSASRITGDGFIACMRNGSAELLALGATIPIGATDTGHSASTWFQRGNASANNGGNRKIMEKILIGIIPGMMFPYDTGHADYNYAMLGHADRQARKEHVKRTSVNIGGGNTMRKAELATSEIIPQISLGVNSRGDPTQFLCAPEVAGRKTLIDVATAQELDNLDELMMRMIMTPDEYIMRNKAAIKHLMSRLATFQANDFVGAFQKGFRSSFWMRQSDADLKVLAEMLHLGASLRLGYPVRNCHKDAFVDEHSGVITKKDGSTTTVTFGMYHAADGETSAEMDIEDDDVQPDGDPTGETVAASFATQKDSSAPAVYAVDASVSPFFVWLENCSMFGAVGDQQGYYASCLEMGLELTPGLFEKDVYENVSRDISFEDIRTGLRWVFDNCGEDHGMTWATVGKHHRENWKDMKAGELVDLYAESSRTDPVNLRAAWNLGLNTTTHFIDGGEPTSVTVGNVGQYYGNGFLDLQKIDEFKRDMHDLSLRNYSVGPRFMKGMQAIGDSHTTVFHKTTDDGKEHYIDMHVMPHALGAWANVPCWFKLGVDTFVLDAGGASTSDYTSVFKMSDSNDPVVFHATGSCLVRACNKHDHYGENLLAGNLSYVFRHDPANPEQPLNWSSLTGTFNHLDPHNSMNGNVIGTSRPKALGHDLSGLVAINPSLTIASSSDKYWDPALLRPNVRNPVARWNDEHTRVLKVIEDSKNVQPYKSDQPDVSVEGVNLVSLLTFNTGNPAIQQLADALFSLASCGDTGGWAISHRAMLDRQLWNPEIHLYQPQRAPAQIDYVGFVLPRGFEASKLLTTLAVSNLVADMVGTLGARGLRDSSRHHELGYEAVRTIYRNEVLPNGVITENAITLVTEGYDFRSDTPAIFANLPAANQSTCQPGIAFHDRLFQDKGEGLIGMTVASGNKISFCNILGTSSSVVQGGSNVPGLTGYARDIEPEVLEVLIGQGVSYDDGVGGQKVDPELIRLMIEKQRGTSNLYFKEAGLQIAMVDQDVFDTFFAIYSAMMSADEGRMLVGPCPHAVVYNSSGEIVHEVSDVQPNETGSGEAAYSKPAASSAPTNDVEVTETEGPTETTESD